jgi:hypothetical protein
MRRRRKRCVIPHKTAEHTLTERKTPVDSAPNLRVQHKSKERKERAAAAPERRGGSVTINISVE